MSLHNSVTNLLDYITIHVFISGGCVQIKEEAARCVVALYDVIHHHPQRVIFNFFVRSAQMQIYQTETTVNYTSLKVSVINQVLYHQ